MKLLVEKIPKRIFIAISGLLLGFSIIFAKIGFIAYLALVPLAFALYTRVRNEKYKLRRAYLDGFIFYMCFDLVALHWFFYFYPLEFLKFSKIEAAGVVLLAWIGLSLLQSIFSAFVFVVIAIFSKTEISKKMPILLAPFAAAIFTVNEWSQTFTWAGVPWSRISISQVEMPILMQSASLFGSYFLTFIIVLINFLLAYSYFSLDKRRFASLCAISVFIGNMLLGTVIYLVPQIDEDKSIKVAAIQCNLESQSNYDVSPTEIFEIHASQTAFAAEQGAELVIWSEGVFAYDLNARIKGIDGKYATIKKHLINLATELGVTICVGSYIYANDDGKQMFYNSVSVFYENGESVINAYAKRKPVPFGEYVPMREVITAVLPVLGQINMLVTDTAAGKESTLYDATRDEDAIKVGTLICFDSIYEQIGIDASCAGAEMFVVPSNDSWFYDSRALNMHHAQNILRAVEQGKYTVSCGNTGITSIVTDKGEILVDMPIYTEGFVIDTVYASSGRTLYSYIGNLFVYICIAGVIFILAFDTVLKRKNKNN